MLRKNASWGADVALLDAAQAANMEQLVSFPTHARGNVLDLLLTNVPERISDLQDAGRLGRSDHCILSFEVRLKAKIARKSTVKNWG
jgi:hypothetical protein